MRTKSLIRTTVYDIVKETFVFDNMSDYAQGLHEYRVKAWYTGSRKLLHKREERVFLGRTREFVNRTLKEIIGNVLLEQILVVDEIGNWARYTVTNYRCNAEREELLRLLDAQNNTCQSDSSDSAIVDSCIRGYAKIDERERARWDSYHLTRVRKALRKDPHAAEFGGIKWRDSSGREWLSTIDPVTGEIRTVLNREVSENV